MTRVYRAVAALSGALALSGCATGEGSSLGFGSDPGSGQTSASLAQEVPLRDAAPELLAVSGNALLPGSRRVSANLLAANTSLLPPGGLQPSSALVGLTAPAGLDVRAAPGTLLGTAVGAAIDPGALVGAQPAPVATVGLTAPLGVTAGAALTGPLLTVNGAGAGLLGPRVATVTGTAPGAAASLTVGGGAAPQTAATRLVVDVTGAVSRVTGAAGGAGLPPMAPPVLGGVPNGGALGAIAGLLPVRPGP